MQIKEAFDNFVKALIDHTEIGPRGMNEIFEHADALSQQLGALDFVHQISKLELKDGDLLALKMGDPAAGWIPAPEDSAKVAKLYRDALDVIEEQTGTRVRLIWHHYGVDPHIARKAEDEA